MNIPFDHLSETCNTTVQVLLECAAFYGKLSATVPYQLQADAEALSYVIVHFLTRVYVGCPLSTFLVTGLLRVAV